MKTKDIITMVVAVALIGVSGYFVYKMLSPATNNKQSTTGNQQQTRDTFTGNIDQTTLDQISSRKDYGEATLDNIGRTNPFGPLN